MPNISVGVHFNTIQLTCVDVFDHVASEQWNVRENRCHPFCERKDLRIIQVPIRSIATSGRDDCPGQDFIARSKSRPSNVQRMMLNIEGLSAKRESAVLARILTGIDELLYHHLLFVDRLLLCEIRKCHFLLPRLPKQRYSFPMPRGF